MKKQLNQLSKGFILFETLMAFFVISFAVLFFYKGSVTFLIEAESRQQELQMYRVLYEEVASGRKQDLQSEQFIVNRVQSYEVEYQLEGRIYGQITGGDKSIRIEKKESIPSFYPH